MDATEADAGGGGPLVAAPTPGQQQQAQPQMRPIDPAEIKHWTCVWPCYLDGSLTVAQGRRLPKSLCGEATALNIYDLAEAAMTCGFQIAIEQGKRHPRADFARSFGMPGRVRVLLKNKEGELMIKDHPRGIVSKETLLVEMAKVIPTLESRKARNADFARKNAEYAAEMAKMAAHKPRKVDKRDKKK